MNTNTLLDRAIYLSRNLCVSVLAALAFLTSGTATAATVQIHLGEVVFIPDYVVIHQGDTIEWIWTNDHGCSVTSGADGVPSGLFDTGIRVVPYTFSYTFQDLGRYDYFCRAAPLEMVGVIEVVDASEVPGILGNISTRLRVETGDNALIGGFIVTGTQPKNVIIRAIGPSLSSIFPGVLSDPVLELHSSGGLIQSNDNWRSDQEPAILATGIPPTHDSESAIVATLPANNSAYTAIVRGVNSGTGIGVVEAYDLDQTVDSKLANISTRGFVQTGDDALIGGLIVLGENPRNVIVRAIGPSLPVPGALADPTLSLYNGNGTLMEFNDNWRGTDPARELQIIATGIPPGNDLEAAILRNLSPGNYTAIVRGAGNTTGVALVEVYALN